MKKYILKSLFLLSVSAATLTSCTSDDDYTTPPFIEAFFIQTFEEHRYGSGSDDEDVVIPGVINVNLTSTPLWNVRQYSNNRYMQFSSFYSGAGTTDNTWLILPAANLNPDETALLDLDIAQAYPVGNFPLEIVYSTDFDGDQANIENATWQNVNFNFPSTTDYFEFVRFQNLEITNNETEAKDVYVAFKYSGAKTGGSTHTIQIDNIKLIKQ